MIGQELFKKKSLFIPFIMAGHPDVKTTIEAIFALAKAKADIIELGMPFSDPVADGPINQRACSISLANGTNLNSVFDIVKIVRKEGITTPIIIFSYLNPLLAFGLKQFAKKARSEERRVGKECKVRGVDLGGRRIIQAEDGIRD